MKLVKNEDYIIARCRLVRNGCWLWRLSVSKRPRGYGGGYGHVSYKGKQTSPHRMAYQIFVGEIPRGLDVHHICVNKACVNPFHLRLVTRKEHAALDDIAWKRKVAHFKKAGLYISAKR